MLAAYTVLIILPIMIIGLAGLLYRLSEKEGS